MYKEQEINDLREVLLQKGIVTEEDLITYLNVSSVKDRMVLTYLELTRLLGERTGFSIGQSFLRTKVQNVLDEE